MKLRRFEAKDLIYNTIVAKPDINFIVHNNITYLQKEVPVTGSFSNNVKHIQPGELSLHELNVNRPAGSMIHSFVKKDSTRYALKNISTSNFDDENQFTHGAILTQSYPLKATATRIYVPAGNEFTASGPVHSNKKYIRALTNAISTQGSFGYGVNYGSLGTSEVNMVCVPGIFFGSGIDKGSVELKYSITGALCAVAKDVYGDGRLFQVSGSTTGSVIGSVVYNQGLILLTSSTSLNNGHTDYYLSTSSASNPSWINFGTGLRQVGEAVEHGSVSNSSYTISFKGVSKIPTLTMYAYVKKGECNHSHNPSFFKQTAETPHDLLDFEFSQRERSIKKINKSPYSDYEEDFENITYISKVGIYDKHKNLIALATLANPIKKTEKRDFMIKLKIDF